MKDVYETSLKDKETNKQFVFITEDKYKELKKSNSLKEDKFYLIREKPWRSGCDCELRVPQLKAMHSFICNANDENITMSWLTGGVPDGADIWDYISIASDDTMYNDICNLFVDLVNKKGWRF